MKQFFSVLNVTVYLVYNLLILVLKSLIGCFNETWLNIFFPDCSD